MIIDEAMKIATGALKSIETQVGVPIEIIKSDVIETRNGWVFFWNSSEYLETGTFSSALAGNGPIFINRDKSIYFLPSNQTWEQSLKKLGLR